MRSVNSVFAVFVSPNSLFSNLPEAPAKSIRLPIGARAWARAPIKPISKLSGGKSDVLPKTRETRVIICCAKQNGKNGDVGNNGDDGDEEEFDAKGFNKFGFDRQGRDKDGLDAEGFDKFGLPGDAIVIGPIDEPDYHTYVDPIRGEVGPTFGARTPLPNAAFWGNDLIEIKRSGIRKLSRDNSVSPTSPGYEESEDEDETDEDGDTAPQKAFEVGRRRSSKSTTSSSSSPARGDVRNDDMSTEEITKKAELQALRDKFIEEHRALENKSDGKEESNSQSSVEEEEGKTLGEIFNVPGYPLASQENGDDEPGEKPLANDELWWNWKKPEEGEQPWSAWQTRPGDTDMVFAAAMAETGQIKLFGETPTLAEATLARARRHVLYDERMEAEEARKKRIGALAYYKEWVKAYKGHTSKEDVQKHFERTGEPEGIQLLDMFAYQTESEYRRMQGTDVRIRRDPLVMRMRPDQIKQVWGGDPVYPTINYEQDPDEWYDYRNENMHEPIPDIVQLLRESGRMKTQAEMKAILDKEKLEDDEFSEYDGMSGAVDIGENDEDDDEDDEYDVDIEMQALRQSKLATTPAKSMLTQEVTFGLDNVEVDVTDMAGIDDDVDDEA